MPNMDDVSFFSSSDYSHRGGIWADAARRERQPTTMDGTTDPNVHLPQVQVETGQGSLSTTLVSPLPPTHDQNFLASTENNRDLDQEHPGDGPRKDESFEASSPPRSITSAIAQTSSTSSSASRRRSWFLPAREEDSNTESEPSPPRADDASSRGRPEITHDLSSSPRSVSSLSDTGPDPYDTRSEPSLLPKTPPPPPRRRGLPQQQLETDETAPAPSRSPQSLLGRAGTSGTIGSNGPTTSSFFSTLKARATDKEALSQSAKETMKKWSANWANLKKGSPDDSAPGTDDGQPKGSSFAEIRRNVEERHRTIITSGNPAAGTKDTPSSNATGNTPAPPRTQGGSRRLSIPGGLSTGSSTSNSDLPGNPVSQDTLADRDDSSREREGETDVTPPAPAPHPIYTQPSAPKMMMIPGIHASHRGEVQSMGYVAPTPEPAELKLKAPAIQSVYRLWKNPGSSQTMPPASKEPTESLHWGGGDAGPPPSQSDLPVSKPSLSASSSPNLKRGVAPPLPARPAAIRPLETSVTRASPDPAEFGNLTASAALKSIVSQDSGSRRHSSSSFEHMDNLQPPPTAVTGNL